VDPEQLSAGLRNREPQAMLHLVDALGDRLLRSAYLLCGHEADAQDLVQETFLQAWRTAHRYRGESSVYTWLHGILLNLTRHHHRARKRLVYCEAPPEHEAVSPQDEVLLGDREFACGALQELLLHLSEAHREVLVLRFFENMKVDQIAAHLGISSGTVKSRLHYALREMHRLMPSELNVFAGGGTEVRTQ
jgi:RNA polymerase sigma factor (sigma-70 family)